jgi:hypothetical protein
MIATICILSHLLLSSFLDFIMIQILSHMDVNALEETNSELWSRSINSRKEENL